MIIQTTKWPVTNLVLPHSAPGERSSVQILRLNCLRVPGVNNILLQQSKVQEMVRYLSKKTFAERQGATMHRTIT